MKAAELREKSLSELKKSLSRSLREKFKLRLNKAGGEMTKTHPIKENRREIARIQTIMAQKQALENQEGVQS